MGREEMGNGVEGDAIYGGQSTHLIATVLVLSTLESYLPLPVLIARGTGSWLETRGHLTRFHFRRDKVGSIDDMWFGDEHRWLVGTRVVCLGAIP